MATRSRGELVESRQLRRGEHDIVGGDVLFQPAYPFGARNRSGVSIFGEQPGDGDLCRRRADLIVHCFDLVGDGEIALKVLAGEPRVGGTEVIGIELVDLPDGAGEETVTERRIQYEADTEFT